MRSLTPGDRIGPYEVVAAIGAGGMGEVYRAHDTTLGRPVALKVLPPGFAGDPARLARLQHEARVLATVNHPNVAAIYGLAHPLEVEREERAGADRHRRLARGAGAGPRVCGRADAG
jgi:serine/threonine protein kinase